jgi:hypothetical protein
LQDNDLAPANSGRGSSIVPQLYHF